MTKGIIYELGTEEELGKSSVGAGGDAGAHPQFAAAKLSRVGGRWGRRKGGGMAEPERSPQGFVKRGLGCHDEVAPLPKASPASSQ